MDQQLQENKTKNGFVTLISVIVLGTIGLLVITSRLSINADTNITLGVFENAKQARALAESCVEVALDNLKTDLSYAGNETLNLFNGSCEISTITGSGNAQRTFTTTGTFENQIKRVEIDVQEINPIIVVNTWSQAP